MNTGSSTALISVVITSRSRWWERSTPPSTPSRRPLSPARRDRNRAEALAQQLREGRTPHRPPLGRRRELRPLPNRPAAKTVASAARKSLATRATSLSRVLCSPDAHDDRRTEPNWRLLRHRPVRGGCRRRVGNVLQVVVSARLVLTGGRVGSYSWFAPPCFIEFFKEFFCVPQGFMLCRVAVGGAVAMLSIFKNGPTKATRTLGVWFNLNCEVGSFGHGHLSARTLRRLGQGYHGSLLAWDEKRPRQMVPTRPPAARPELRGAIAEARGGGKLALPASAHHPRLRRIVAP